MTFKQNSIMISNPLIEQKDYKNQVKITLEMESHYIYYI